VGDGVVYEPRGRIEGVAEKDALPSFGAELGALRGVNVNVGGVAKDAKVGEVRFAYVKCSVGDDVSSFGPH